MNFISIHFGLMGYQMLRMASKISYDKLSYSSLHPVKLRQIIGMNIILLEKYNTVCTECSMCLDFIGEPDILLIKNYI